MTHWIFQVPVPGSGVITKDLTTYTMRNLRDNQILRDQWPGGDRCVKDEAGAIPGVVNHPGAQTKKNRRAGIRSRSLY